MRLKLLISIILIAAVSAVYWQVGTHEFLIYDDDLYITRNPAVTGGLSLSAVHWAFTSFEQCNWHPLTWLSHMLDVQLFGLDPRGHHFMNVGYHLAATLLLFLLLARISSSVWKSFFVAALFALHPLRVESVAWAAERKDVLSACFWFLTLLLYAGYAERRRAGNAPWAAMYLGALAAYACGLMAKPMLVTLPVVMLVLDFWPLARWQPSHSGSLLPAARSLFLEKLPFLAFALFSSAITFYAQRAGGAVVALEWIPLPLRLQNALVSYLRYITKTIWPTDLAVLYPFSNTISPALLLAAGVVLLTVSYSAIRFREQHPFLLTGWFWYVVTLVPVIGIVQVGNQSMADRYSYIPSVGLYIMVVWGAVALAERVAPVSRIARGSLACSGCALLLIYAVMAWKQTGLWRNNVTLFSHSIAVTANNHVIHFNLGLAYARSGNIGAAVKEFHTAVRIKPNDARLRNILAATLAEHGYIDAAIMEFMTVLARDPSNQEALLALEYWRKQKR